MVNADGVLPLPWIAEPLQQALDTRRAHALLVHGEPGVGQFELALTMAQAWLCEAPRKEADDPSSAKRPCGRCAACKLVQSHSHPDLMVVIPEAFREALGWSNDSSDDDGSDKASKSKPSKEIKVDAVRAVVAFSQTTAARGHGKVVLVHPAERMNAIAANTLLKTLEEPPGLARFVLCSAAPDALLPTIRSRCQSLVLRAPPHREALEWLKGRGVDRAEVLLLATGGHPLEALEWSEQGVDAALWQRLPALVARGDAAALSSWPLPRLINSLQKLSHDALCIAVGAMPRYFPEMPEVNRLDMSALLAWVRELERAARHSEHTWQSILMTESLVQQGREALSGGRHGTLPATQSRTLV